MENILTLIDFKKHGLNPVIWQNQEVRLVKCEGGFWIKMPDNSYQKNKNKMLVITEQEAKSCRVAYLVANNIAIEDKKQVQQEEKTHNNPLKSRIDDFAKMLFRGDNNDKKKAVQGLYQIVLDNYEGEYQLAHYITDIFDNFFYQQMCYKEQYTYDEWLENKVQQGIELLVSKGGKAPTPLDKGYGEVQNYYIRSLGCIKRRIVCEKPYMIEDANLLHHISKLEYDKVHS